jgi:hypothetical protein
MSALGLAAEGADERSSAPPGRARNLRSSSEGLLEVLEAGLVAEGLDDLLRPADGTHEQERQQLFAAVVTRRRVMKVIARTSHTRHYAAKAPAAEYPPSRDRSAMHPTVSLRVAVGARSG